MSSTLECTQSHPVNNVLRLNKVFYKAKCLGYGIVLGVVSRAEQREDGPILYRRW